MEPSPPMKKCESFGDIIQASLEKNVTEIQANTADLSSGTKFVPGRDKLGSIWDDPKLRPRVIQAAKGVSQAVLLNHGTESQEELLQLHMKENHH